jgi:hypothetical protein
LACEDIILAPAKKPALPAAVAFSDIVVDLLILGFAAAYAHREAIRRDVDVDPVADI